MLKQAWNTSGQQSTDNNLYKYRSKDQVDNLDTSNTYQLKYVFNTCQHHNIMGTAVRELFYVRRTLRSQPNDSSHLQKNLSKYGLKWEDISTSINLKL